jgi:NH3-dependent NAD+ synthetase
MEINGAEEIDRISRRMREVVGDALRKKGAVVAVSGGIDSSVCAALSVRALGASRVFALANALGLPEAILAAKPTTDTYSLEQGQDEFFFALPYDKMDLLLFGLNHGLPAARVAEESGLTAEQVERVFQDIRTKRRTTRPLHMKPVLMEPVPEVDVQ